MSRTPTPLLWIVYTCLMSSTFSIEYIAKNSLNTEQKEYLTKMEALWGAEPLKDQPLFLNELKEGREYIHPDDPNKTVRIHYYDTSDGHEYLLAEVDKLSEFSTKDIQLNGSPRFSQRIYKVLCTYEQNIYTLIMELERFRGNLLEQLVEERGLLAYMIDFGNRLSIYSQLALIMQNYFEMGYKHCALDSSRIIYKREGDDFSQALSNDSAVQVALGDLRFVTPLDTPCTKGLKFSQDHDDALKKIPKTDKCKRKIEMFGLAMIFVEIEVYFMTLVGDPQMEDRLTAISKGYKEFPDAPSDLETLFKRKDPFKGKTPAEMLYPLRTMISNWNNGKVTKNKIEPSFDSINKDIAYIMRALSLIFSLIEEKRCNDFAKNPAALKQILGTYAEFNKMVLKMLDENDYVSGRPNQQEVSDKALALMKTFKDGEALYSRRRLLIV